MGKFPFLRCCCKDDIAHQPAAAPEQPQGEEDKSKLQQKGSSLLKNGKNNQYAIQQKGGSVRQTSCGSDNNNNNNKSSVSSLWILEEDSTGSNSMNLSFHDSEHQKQEEYRPSTPSPTHSTALTEETTAMTPPHGNLNSFTMTETQHKYTSVSGKSLTWHGDHDENLQTVQDNEEPEKQQDREELKSAEQQAFVADLSSPATQAFSRKEKPGEPKTTNDFATEWAAEKAGETGGTDRKIEKEIIVLTEQADEQETEKAQCNHHQTHQPRNLDTTDANKTVKSVCRYRGNSEVDSEERVQLRQQIKEALAATLSQEEMEALFEKVDINGDGTLSLTEIEKAMFQRVAPQCDLKPVIVFRAFHKADLHGNRKIDKDEFFVFVRMLAYFDNMRFVFSKLDSDGDRQLSQQ